MALMGDDKKAARHKAALQLAVDRSVCATKKLPAGTAWGVAVNESFESVVAYVVEAKIAGKGKDRKPVLTAVTAGVHCNFCVNPRTVEAQVQGSVMMALATTMPGHRITLKDGVVEQGNFHEFIPARIGDTPPAIAGAHRAEQRPAQGHGRTRRAAAGAGVRECDREADGAADEGAAV
jgi:isoquinoline 1-oxidoreductase subunit beta